VGGAGVRQTGSGENERREEEVAARRIHPLGDKAEARPQSGQECRETEVGGDCRTLVRVASVGAEVISLELKR
jgi:hypothetical protein